ncbi:hypothetical protein CEXT_52711 [Caerostris extrusa]|uniref:Uncharacterized protein n=1 Tax=Caerostris extrusa TaxID=172846 RepID=A0AAV4TNS0_CAEEX|nr:hypothetical protein CEXT_52711 [Caerostris extrusa]
MGAGKRSQGMESLLWSPVVRGRNVHQPFPVDDLGSSHKHQTNRPTTNKLTQALLATPLTRIYMSARDYLIAFTTSITAPEESIP